MNASVGRLVSAVAVGGMATAGLVSLAVPAVAVETPQFTVSPNEVGPGQRTLLKGDGCASEGVGGEVFADFGEVDEGDAPWHVEAGEDGKWQVAIEVPAVQPDGTVEVAALCVREGVADIDYTPVPLTVKKLSLTLSPTTVAAGGTLTVSGEHCIPDGHAQAAVKPVGNVSTIAVADAPVGDDPHWEATLTIPANTAAGSYRVVAVCRDHVAAGDAILFAYQEAEFEVTVSTPSAPTVKAVKATPRYTG